MLYQLYETQRSLMEPFSDLALAAAKLYGNPLSMVGQNPFAQRLSAGYDLMHRLGKDYEKPEFGLRTIDVDGVDVAIHERVEITKPFCELRRFKRFTDENSGSGGGVEQCLNDGWPAQREQSAEHSQVCRHRQSDNPLHPAR